MRSVATARRAVTVAIAAVTVMLGAGVVLVPAARAGDWMQISCVNPDGSAAPSEGWSAGSTGAPETGSVADVQCGPGSPLSAGLSQFAAAPQGATEYLDFQPPSGSTLVGGSADVSLSADGYGSGGEATYAAVYAPALLDDTGDVIVQCVAFVGPCSPGTADTTDFSGVVAIPANRGGGLYAQAGCTAGSTGAVCAQGGKNGEWASAQVVWAHLLLSSATSPRGTGFSGSALQGHARGTAHVVFTAAAPGGPGVYVISAAIDGRTVWAGNPNSNGGRCAALGTDPGTGALMFDWAQPCLTAEVVDVPVPTAGLADGAHELAVTVTDAAGNTSTVLDTTITTSNPQVTPPAAGRAAIHARFTISWHWSGRRTRLRSITVRRLPRAARVTIGCSGPHCPRPRARSRRAAFIGQLLRGLDGLTLTAGDRLLITVTAPGHRTERIVLRIRDNRVPSARLLAR